MRLYATAGITEPNLTPEPLGTEGEMTPGPDDENPYDTGDTDSQIQLPPFIGAESPLGGGELVDDMADAQSDRNQRMDAVFEFGEGRPGTFRPERASFW